MANSRGGISRRSFFTGVGAGALGAYGAGKWLSASDVKPPWSLEHSVDSYWMADAGYAADRQQSPLNQKQYTTDVLIIGGGYTGMSTAWHLQKKSARCQDHAY